jgi:hypothetical protein
MLQVFYMNVAYVAHACCNCMFQMFYLFRTYVAANALCCKCSMSRREKWRSGGGTLRHSCPRTHGKQSGCGGPHMHSEVVPSGTAVPAHTGSKAACAAVATHGDNSRGATTACGRAGRSCTPCSLISQWSHGQTQAPLAFSD